MVKALLFLIILSIILVSGCSTETGKITEKTALTTSEALPQETQTPENIEELHREFEEFEKSQTELLPEELNETTEAAQPIENESTIPEEESVRNESIQKQCPSCEDSNPCTKDSCSEDTDYECVHEPVIPCCGNSVCEQEESWSSCTEDCECSMDCGPCETPDNESCSCIQKTECIQDSCCPENCAYPEDPDCPKPSMVFSEIYYNPNGTDTDHEWLEIYNNGTVPVEITKWRFLEEETNHLISNISDETILSQGSYAIIAQNSAQFILDYPEFSGTLFDSTFSLKNTGEMLALKTGANGEIIDSVFYNSTWGGYGNGFSLEKINLNGPGTQENWNQSLAEKGTPGQARSF